MPIGFTLLLNQMRSLSFNAFFFFLKRQCLPTKSKLAWNLLSLHSVHIIDRYHKWPDFPLNYYLMFCLTILLSFKVKDICFKISGYITVCNIFMSKYLHYYILS